MSKRLFNICLNYVWFGEEGGENTILVSLCSVRPGMFREAMKAWKKAVKNPPTEIKIIATYATFGVFDAVIIFEAPDEATAAKFITGVQDVFQTETFLAIPLEKM